MSRSEVEPQIIPSESEAPRAARPCPSIERAFRWIVEYRSQPNFEHVPDRVTA